MTANSRETAMEQIALADTARRTTRLGFGCSSIMGAMGRRGSLRVLDCAYDAGIRHFDVAPMYGYGEAESCVGDLLRRHPTDITVTTKYGIPPAAHSILLRFGRRLAGPVIKFLPAVKQRLARAANAAATHNQHRPFFTASQAALSLQRSLAALRTSRIDLWLLHEAAASDLQDDTLLRFLEDQVAEGTIGSFGVGSSRDKIGPLLTQRPAYCRVLQYDWSVLDTPTDRLIDLPVPPSPGFRIHHRALTSNFRDLLLALTKNQPLCRSWSQSVGSDLADPAALARLMLKASLLLNPDSIILFSSKSPRHIQNNAQTSVDSSLDAPARRLYQLLRTERSHLLPAQLENFSE